MATHTEMLTEFARTAEMPKITEIVPGIVYHVSGFGHSNATFIVAESSVILIDTLDSEARGKRLREIIRQHTTKPIRAIIYTHGHPDHRGGAGSLIEDEPEIIAFAPVRPLLGRSHLLSDVLSARGARQFGYNLPDDQVITQGLGPREGITQGERYAFVPPTTVYSGPAVSRTIDGIHIELVAAPGETDDTIFVWIPQHGVLCCGDNYYACWPNLSAIRGHQYRDIDAWISSLQLIIDKGADALLPGHFAPIIGEENVQERLTNYRQALDYVLENTLTLLNQGLTPREIVSQLKLPDHLAALDYLREFYGTIEWSVYGIFSGYLGWFDGNPSNLHPLAVADRSRRLIHAMGGVDSVQNLASNAVDEGDFQWSLELTDMLLAVDKANVAASATRIAALRGAASNELNATARNYYNSSAAEMDHPA